MVELQEAVVAFIRALLRERLRLTPIVAHEGVTLLSELELCSACEAADLGLEGSFFGGHFTS